jgi:hypothetical protein
MKKAIYLLFIIPMLLGCGGRQRIVDYTVISTLVEIHKSEQSKYKSIKENEVENLLLQKLVSKHTEENRSITEKIKQRYVNTNLVLTEVGKLPQALKTIDDIENYQKSILESVKERPVLSAIAIKTEIAILKRVNRLYNYIYLNAIIGTDFNRMPIAERLRIVDYVLQELRVIRGYCYTIDRKMKNAKRGNTLRKLIAEYDPSLVHRLSKARKTEIINDVMKN